MARQHQNWRVKAIEKADSKMAKFIEHQQASDWLNNWGNESK